MQTQQKKPDGTSEFSNTSFKPLGRQLYTKINGKLLEKIKANEFVVMADILDTPPSPPGIFNLMIFIFRLNTMEGLGNHRVKRKKYLTIDTWTDAFSIFASNLRQGIKGNSELPEDLAIYMDLIRSLQKDRGDWHNHDVTFRKAKQADISLSWRQVDQVLYSRALLKKMGGPSITTNSFQRHSFRRFCFTFNEGKPCATNCKYAHI